MDNIIETYSPVKFRGLDQPKAEEPCSRCDYFGPIPRDCDASDPLCEECFTDERIAEACSGSLNQEFREYFAGEDFIVTDTPEDLFICATRKAEGFLHRDCQRCGTAKGKATA